MPKNITLLLFQLASLFCFFAFGSTSSQNFSETEIEMMRETLRKRSKLPQNLFIIGHRGMGESNCRYPENTLPSFKQAILLGADGIEFDIFESKDRHILVIHDDELWKNVYGVDRKGNSLPENENHDTFRVSQKHISELTEMAVGPNGESPPTIIELFEFIEEANAIRQRFKKPPIFLNIDMKYSSIAMRCIEEIETYLKENPESTIDFKNIYLTSPNMNCLVDLKSKAIQRVPQIATSQIYGPNNVGKGYVIKNPSKINLEFLRNFFKQFPKYHFDGIDCVLWDVNSKLITFCKNKNISMHLFASNLKHFNSYQKFASFIFYTTQQCNVFLKTDCVGETLEALVKYSKPTLSLREKIALKRDMPLQKPLPLMKNLDRQDL